MAASNILAGGIAALEDAVRDLYYYIREESSGGGMWNDEVGSSYAEYASRLFDLVKKFSDDRESFSRLEETLNTFDGGAERALLDNISRSVKNL